MPKDSAYPSRVLRTRQEAREVYNRLSRWYDHLSGSEAPFKAQALRMLAVQKGETVLEIGFGTGQLLPELAEQAWLQGRVVGIDLSPGMASVARRRLRAAEPRPGVSLHLGDAAALPYPPGCFDAILVTFTLELFDTPEIPCVLSECRRVLQESGRLCVAALALPAQANLITRAYDWFHRVLPAWADCRPIPLQACLTASSFTLQDAWTGSLWGLPVEIATAKRGNKTDP